MVHHYILSIFLVMMVYGFFRNYSRTYRRRRAHSRIQVELAVEKENPRRKGFFQDLMTRNGYQS